MTGRRWALAVLVALVAAVGLATVVPAPAETVRPSRPGRSEPVVAAALGCPWVGGEPRLTSTVSATTLPASALPGAAVAAAGADPAGSGEARVELLAGTDPSGSAAEPLLTLDARGTTASATVDVRRPTGVGSYASGPLAPGLVTETSVRGSRPGEVRGLASTPCTAPVTETWFVGPSGEIGIRARLVIANPGDVPAVVSVRAWGEDGPIDAPGADDIGIPGRGERDVALDALAPGQLWLAVQVVAGAGRVSAGVQVRAVDGLSATGLSWVPQTLAPTRRVVVAGVPGTGRRTLLVAAPGEEDAVVSLRLLGPRGRFSPEGKDVLTVPAGTVRSVDLGAAAGTDAVAVELTSDVPVTAGVRVERTTSHGLPDFAYSAAGPVLAGPAATFVPDDGLRSELLLSAPGRAGRARLLWLDAAGRQVASSAVDVAAGSTTAVEIRPPRSAAGGSLVVVPGAAGRLDVVRASSGTGDGGALLDLVPLTSPRVLVRVPEVAQDLSTGLSAG